MSDILVQRDINFETYILLYFPHSLCCDISLLVMMNNDFLDNDSSHRIAYRVKKCD